MVGFRAFWWYYFAHVYTWRPITKSKWLVGLGGQNFFHPQGGRSPMFSHPSPYATVHLHLHNATVHHKLRPEYRCTNYSSDRGARRRLGQNATTTTMQ